VLEIGCGLGDTTVRLAGLVGASQRARGTTHGGLLNMVVWRRKLDNEFMHGAELVVAEYLEEPEESDVPRCGPGPFSMANADTVTDVMKSANDPRVSGVGQASRRER
jgi:hypothetical protein